MIYIMRIRKLCSHIVLLMVLWAVGTTAFAQIGYEYSVDLRKDVTFPGKVFVDVFVEDIAGAPNGDSLGNANFVFTIKDTSIINFHSGTIDVRGPYDAASNPGGYLAMGLGKSPHAEGAIINLQVKALTSIAAVGNWVPIGPTRTLVGTISFDLKTCPGGPIDASIIDIRRPTDAAPKGSITKAHYGLPIVVLSSNFSYISPAQSLVYKPTITSVTPNDTICEGDSITFVSDIDSRWKVDITNIDGGSYISTAGYRFTTAGNYTVYAYNDDPDLSGCFDSVLVVVNPKPIITLPANGDDFCDGSLINFTSNVAGDWFDVDNGNVQLQAASNNFSINLSRVNGANGGAKESRKIQLVTAAGCDTSITINLNYVPTFSIAAPDTFCSGTSAALTEDSTVSVTFWDITNSVNIATGNSTSYTLPTVSVPTTITIRAVTDTTTQGGCFVEKTLVIMPIPDNTLIVSTDDPDTTICATQAFNVIIDTPTDAQMTYVAYAYRQDEGIPFQIGLPAVGNGATLNITIPAGTLNTGTVDSTYEIKVFVYNTDFPACGDTLTDTTTITVKPVPGAVTVADQSRCGAGSFTLVADYAANWYDMLGALKATSTQVFNTGIYTDGVTSANDSFVVARTNGSCDGPIDTVVVTVNPSLKVVVKTYLDGPYDLVGDTMFTNLYANVAVRATMNAAFCDTATVGDPTGFIPTTAVMDTALGFTPIPANVVDIIEIELRDGSDNPVDKSYAWLMSNGDIKDFATGTTGYAQFCAAPDGNYRVVIRHRNHISIQSFDAGNAYDRTIPAALDLTAPASVYEGNDIVNTMMRDNSRIRMAAGNAYPNMAGFDRGECNASDFYIVSVENDTNAANVYNNADLNLDGNVSATDFNLVDTNSLNLYYASFPNP